MHLDILYSLRCLFLEHRFFSADISPPFCLSKLGFDSILIFSGTFSIPGRQLLLGFLAWIGFILTMVRPRREGFGEEANGDSSDRFDRPHASEGSDESTEIDGFESSGDTIDVRSSGLSGALPGRIRDVLRDGADANLLLGSDEVENGILQWLRALDLQVIGGCRADERLMPMLKLNASSGAAEDQFMAQLLQHFEASEVAVLARCLCLPLVSVRVGKISKQGNMLCPNTSR